VKSLAYTLKTSVIEYCSAIGADPLLVQGAGGNVSWKDEGTLWIKASGTWLAEAAEKNIFVPVDLLHIRNAIENGIFSVPPRLREETVLRPSIETFLHALMPHRVVVHLHPVEILAHLVRDDCEADFLLLLDSSIHWAIVEYHKPGESLAAAVNATLARQPNIDVIFLKNHGVVIGGTNVAVVSNILGMLTEALSTSPSSICKNPLTTLPRALDLVDEYAPIVDADVHQLALNTELFNRLATNWALYPDHVVFLGERAHAYNTWQTFVKAKTIKHEQPELVFILGNGVFVKPTFNAAKSAQLRCYYDVLTRQSSSSHINTLTNVQIAEVLNWDAEQYRINLAKSN
jgi:rhamnose utilization protein RhaD (predicted bifunctional aldolase and dehydrogenase)